MILMTGVSCENYVSIKKVLDITLLELVHILTSVNAGTVVRYVLLSFFEKVRHVSTVTILIITYLIINKLSVK